MLRSIIGVLMLATALPLNGQLANLSSVAVDGERAGRSLAVASAYLNDYFFRNMDQLAEYWTDSTVMRDRAWGVETVGRERLIESVPSGWAGVDVQAIRRLGYMASASGIVIFSLEGEGSIESDGQSMNFNVPFTLIVRIDDDKVTEHDDFPDYECLGRQMLAQNSGPLPVSALPACHG